MNNWKLTEKKRTAGHTYCRIAERWRTEAEAQTPSFGE
jgi:hypothetical protein